MNRRFTMCVFLTVLALAGVWSVHSVGQDIFDDPLEDELTATDDSSDDLFGGDATATEDAFNDGGAGDEPEDDLLNEPEDDLFDDPTDLSRNTFDESSEDDIGNLDTFGDIEDIDLGGVEPEAEDDLDVGFNSDVGQDYDLLDLTPGTGGSSRFGSRRSAHDVRSRQATQQLTQVQQTILQRYMRTENKNTRDKLTEQLTDAVRREFDVRQKQRTEELKVLEKELKRLWSIHQRRDREKNSIVRNRVRQLIRDKEGLGWGSENVSRRFR